MSRVAAITSALAALAAAAFAGCGPRAAPPPTATARADHDHHHAHDDAVDEAAAGDGHDHDHRHAVGGPAAGGGHDHHHGDAATPSVPPTPPAPPDAAQVRAELLAAETAAYQAARPVFTTYCAACHQQGGAKATAKKLGHFDMTAYPFGGHHAAEIAGEIREALGVDGGKPTMPKGKPGVVQGDELASIVAWAVAWDAAEAGGAHPPRPRHGH